MTCFYEARGTTWALIHFLKRSAEIDFADVLRKEECPGQLATDHTRARGMPRHGSLEPDGILNGTWLSAWWPITRW